MRIDISLSTLKDLSGEHNGNKLVDILSSYGFIIEKIDKYEPVKKEFSKEGFEKLWEGYTSPAGITSCSMIFKGTTDVKFTGMVSWGKNKGPKPLSVNMFSLWLNVKKNYDITKLVNFADEIFEWSRAEYGYISEKGKTLNNVQIRVDGFGMYPMNMYTGLYGLMWTNYFGKAYLSEKDFVVPENAVKLAHGVRLQLTERPDDERLSDLRFLETYYSTIGDKWFWHFDEIVKDGRNYIAHLKKGFHQGEVSIPKFDRSEITRKED